MAKLAFEYKNYKKYLRELIRAQPAGGRGFRARLADACGVQRTFVSQVLDKDLHFSLEQAERVSVFLGHGDEEKRYFLFSIQHARAGTDSLKEFFLAQMKAIISHRLVISNRLRNERTLSYENEARYYSTWQHQAIRCALALPELRSAEALSRRFGISRKKVRESLEFLVSAGLAEKKGDGYLPSAIHMHLSDDSTMRMKRHSSWLLKALTALDDQSEQDLHFSGVLTLSQEDAVAIKAKIVAHIEEILKQAQPSLTETLYTFCLDYFEL